MFPFWIAVTIFLAITLSGYACIRLNRVIQINTEPPRMLGDLRRNFDYLLLGSTNVWGRCHFVGEEAFARVLSFAQPLRNLWGDYLVLQHMHSYLKSDGIVVLTVDYASQNNLQAKGLNYADLQMLHPVTLSSLGQRAYQRKLAYPLLYFPNYCLGYVYYILVAKFKSRRRWLVGSGKITGKDATYQQNLSGEITQIIKRVSEFCDIRSLGLKVIFIACDEFASENSLEIIESLRSESNRPECHIVEDPEQIISILA